MPANFGIGTLETCRLLLEAAGPGGADGSARPDFTFEHERLVGTGSRPAMAARRQDGDRNEMPASAPKRVADARGKPWMQEDIRGGEYRARMGRQRTPPLALLFTSSGR